MSKLVACLGYNLMDDGSIHPILGNRLQDAVEYCKQHTGSTLLLMGSSSFHDTGKPSISQAEAMKKYLEEKLGSDLGDTNIVLEETTQSTVEQIYHLKKIISEQHLNYSDLVIISSKFFSDRVKLYSEYIFGTNDGVTFVESQIPANLTQEFQDTEKDKSVQALEWLKGHTKGDDTSILAEQKVFQSKIISGEIKHKIS